MPYCENEGCGKKNLGRTEVEVDEATNKVICLDCHSRRYGIRKPIPVRLADGEIGWGIHLTSDKGLQAEVRVGEVQLQLTASNDDLKEILGRNE